MAKKKFTKKLYTYSSGSYLREKLNSKRGCKEYRIKEIKDGVKLLLCITDKKGKRGGKTKALAILRSKDLDLRKYRDKPTIKKYLKKLRKQ